MPSISNKRAQGVRAAWEAAKGTRKEKAAKVAKAMGVKPSTVFQYLSASSPYRLPKMGPIATAAKKAASNGAAKPTTTVVENGQHQAKFPEADRVRNELAKMQDAVLAYTSLSCAGKNWFRNYVGID